MFDKILAAIDLDQEGASTVLDKAQALCKGELWVIHSVEPQYVQYSIDPTFTGSLTRAMEEDAIKAARALLAEVCSGRGIDDDHQLISIGRAADQIHTAATDIGVDTIVIGSPANAVLHGSPVNVMTVRIDK